MSEDKLIPEGYVLFGFQSPNNEEITAAYALACSIKSNDKNRPVALIVDAFDSVPSKYEGVFDYVIESPYGSNDYETGSKLADIWQMYHCTPFEKNLYIKNTSLLMCNIDGLWESLSEQPLAFPQHTVNFQGMPSRYNSKTETLVRNKFPIYHADVFYFEQCAEAAEFFKLCDPLFKNWRTVFTRFVQQGKPEWFNLSEMVSIVAKVTDINLAPLNTFKYTDIGVDNIIVATEDIPEEWVEFFNIWLYKGKMLKVNNHMINGIAVYHQHNFLTSENINDITSRYKETQRLSSN